MPRRRPRLVPSEPIAVAHAAALGIRAVVVGAVVLESIARVAAVGVGPIARVGPIAGIVRVAAVRVGGTGGLGVGVAEAVIVGS